MSLETSCTGIEDDPIRESSCQIMKGNGEREQGGQGTDRCSSSFSVSSLLEQAGGIAGL